MFDLICFIKQLNPYNVQINESNRNEYVKVDEMRSIADDEETREMLTRIKLAKDVKKHYFGMEFTDMDNPEYENKKFYPTSLLRKNNRLPSLTPQFNNISFMLPTGAPILYEWNNLPKVKSQE